MNKEILFFIIGLVVTLFAVWLIGFYISLLDALWFYSTVIGRVIAVILILITITVQLKALNE